MSKIIEADAATLAGLQIDMLTKFRKGHITLDHIKWFVGLSKHRRNVLMKSGWIIFNPGDEIDQGETALAEPSSSFEFPTWKTIRLGTHKSVDFLKTAIRESGLFIDEWANDIMGKSALTLASEETSIDLVTATVAELGTTDGARYEAICARIYELGYDLCPAEVGPQLRRQYMDQPPHEQFVIAMKAIYDSDDNPSVFSLTHNYIALSLSSTTGNATFIYPPNSRFVFVRRKPAC